MIRKLLILLASAACGFAAQPYNILVVMCDDWGVDFTSLNTHPDAVLPSTPEIDALAAGGVTFTEFRTSAQCAQTRASFLTGRYPYLTTVDFVGAELPESEYTIADDLSDNHSYETAMFGKWNLGGYTLETQDVPRTLGGFDHFSGSYPVWSYRAPHYGFNKTTNGGAPVTQSADTYITTDQANDAIAWIGAATEPWFVELCFHAPHSSGTGSYLYPPVSLQRNFTGTPNTHGGINGYLSMMEAIDTEFGRVLDACDLSQTVVAFFGDNGSAFANAGVPSDRIKGTDSDNGTRAPLIIRSPNTTNPGRTSAVFCHMVDLYPSLVRLATGTAADSPNPLSGQDISGAMHGEAVPLKIQWDSDNQDDTDPVIVSNGDFRLYDYATDPDEFYDLRSDRYEQTNLGTEELTGSALRNYKNLRYAITTFSAKTGEQPEVTTNYAKPSVVTGGIKVVKGGTKVSIPVVGSATISAPEKSGASNYYLWKKAGDFAVWEQTDIDPVVSGGTVTFTDPNPEGRPIYRITNDAPEP